MADHVNPAPAEFCRVINDYGMPDSCGLRLFNGADQQQITVFLPKPFPSPEMKIQPPDRSRLALSDYLRKKYLGLEPEARARQGGRMIHS